MRPRTRQAILAMLILLSAGLWWVLRDSPPLDPVPNYTVLNQLPGGESVADVLIPSLFRGDENREKVFHAIATTEGLDTAFFFSTDEALEAHQAFLPSPDQLENLQAGFLGQVRDGVFTPGEDVYPE